ncbi:MAG: ABC transporter substrate binding protein [Candidatus Competibacteraceae bacterium]|nr:ABC transporter substrate binding protein [Candidatus Competibacteraceae bacterium]
MLALVLLVVMPWLYAAERTALVMYPVAPPPYDAAFAQMIEGLTHSLDNPPHTLALPERYDLDEIRQWLSSHRKPDTTVVVLGQRALGVAEQLNSGLPLMVGGVTQLPNQKIQAPGVSLTIDTTLFLKMLKRLLPATRTVVVVYNAQQPGLIPLLEEKAKQQSLNIELVAVSDAADAVRKLTRTFAAADPKSTALWFTRNTLSLNNELLFPFVLEETWKRRLPAFSETVAHTRRGLLFALYPDYVGIGEELGNLIKDAPETPTGITFTRAAQLALNTRTARHLGLILDAEILSQAAVLFPAVSQ